MIVTLCNLKKWCSQVKIGGPTFEEKNVITFCFSWYFTF